MTFKRRVLAALGKPDLLGIARDLDLEVTSRMTVEEVRDALAKSKRGGSPRRSFTTGFRAIRSRTSAPPQASTAAARRNRRWSSGSSRLEPRLQTERRGTSLIQRTPGPRRRAKALLRSARGCRRSLASRRRRRARRRQRATSGVVDEPECRESDSASRGRSSRRFASLLSVRPAATRAAMRTSASRRISSSASAHNVSGRGRGFRDARILCRGALASRAVGAAQQVGPQQVVADLLALAVLPSSQRKGIGAKLPRSCHRGRGAGRARESDPHAAADRRRG